MRRINVVRHPKLMCRGLGKDHGPLFDRSILGFENAMAHDTNVTSNTRLYSFLMHNDNSFF